MSTGRHAQPGEGIFGRERAGDDLLDLDERAIARRRLWIGAAAALHRAVLVGTQSAAVARLYEQMYHPKTGDLVVEVGSFFTRDPDKQIRGFGILLARREEWESADAEWADAVAADAWLDPVLDRIHMDAWYIQYGPAAADVCRWVNCRFIAIPTTQEIDH